MENNDEKLLRKFLEEAKAEIKHDHFSNCVIRRLPPKRKKTGWIVSAFTLLGMVIALLMIDIQSVASRFFDALIRIPLPYLLGGISAFPLLFLLCYYLSARNRQVHGF